MADAKKPDGKKPDSKKPASGSGGPSLESEIFFFLIIGAALLFIILPTLFKSFNISSGTGGTWVGFVSAIRHFFAGLFTTVTFVSIFSVLFLCLGIFYAKFRLNMVKDDYATRSSKSVHMPAPHSFEQQRANAVRLPGGTEEIQKIVLPVNPRWKKIEEHMQSSNSSDWRLAIIEADIILYDMLEQMGYEGNSIADKLKQTNPDSFKTINDAWKAHKVRNVLAHEGASYVLGRSEAEQTIKLFKKVFDEFYFI